MANSFCRHLSNTYRFYQKDKKLIYNPCCLTEQFSKKVETREELQLARIETTREILLDVEKNCYECLARERAGYRVSMRNRSFERIPETAVDGDAYILELQIDTTCNAACVICNPNLSSLWQKQKGLEVSNDFSQLYQQAISLIDFDKIKHVKFLGGEPLLTSTHYEIMKIIPNPKNVQISYNTNGSIFPKEPIIDLWSQFKSVHIGFSVDGIGKQFQYIRWPLKWDQVEKNIKRLQGITPNMTNSILYAVNPLNAWYFNEVEDWLKTFDNKIELGGSPAIGPWGIDGTPPWLRKEIYEKYPNNRIITGILDSFPFSEKKL